MRAYSRAGGLQHVGESQMLAPELHSRQAGPQLVWLLDGQIHQLSDSVGGCERINNTPIPYPYGVLLHRTVYFYCFLLPFGLVDAIGPATPLISVFVAYTLFALEAIAQQVAEPFGGTPNGLALDAMTRTIERSLLELCGEELPQWLDHYNEGEHLAANHAHLARLCGPDGQQFTHGRRRSGRRPARRLPEWRRAPRHPA
jgi:predicted membrane chloride channel (bestrophin family)